jgi:hypothetical protein
MPLIPVDLNQLPPDAFKVPPLEIKQLDRDGLQVTFRKQEFDAETGEAKFTGGVTAKYGPTELVAESLVVNYKTKLGRAVGKVIVTDPDGTLVAQDLEFDWENKRGVANSVVMRVEGSTLTVSRVEINPASDPGHWVLYNVRATPSRTNPPEYVMTARKARIVPGKSGKVDRPGIEFFGVKLGTIPYYNFSLDRRVSGFRLPAPTFVRGSGIGVAWNSAFLLNDNTGIFGRIGSIPGALPSTVLEITYSPKIPDSQIGKLSTRPDNGDRLNDSYLDNVSIKSAQRELGGLRRSAETGSIGTYWNQGTNGRFKDAKSLSKLFEAAYEVGGPVGEGAFLAQGRIQRIRGDNNESWKDRGVIQLVGHSGMIGMTKRVDAFVRIDSNTFLDRGSQFSYLRFGSGLMIKPSKNLTVTGGYVRAFEVGRARYEWDRLYTRNGVHGRADFILGPLLGSGLVKYDLDRKEWSSIEYQLSLIAGSFEPYFRFRQNPKETEFGVRIRVNSLFDRLSNRKIERKNAQK